MLWGCQADATFVFHLLPPSIHIETCRSGSPPPPPTRHDALLFVPQLLNALAGGGLKGVNSMESVGR